MSRKKKIRDLDLIGLWRAGTSTREMAAIFGAKAGTVLRRLDQLGIARRSGATPDDVPTLIRLYFYCGLEKAGIARLVGISNTEVEEAVQRMKLCRKQMPELGDEPPCEECRFPDCTWNGRSRYCPMQLLGRATNDG